MKLMTLDELKMYTGIHGLYVLIHTEHHAQNCKMYVCTCIFKVWFKIVFVTLPFNSLGPKFPHIRNINSPYICNVFSSCPCIVRASTTVV